MSRPPTPKLEAFIKEMIEALMPIDEIMKRHGVTQAEYAKWTSRPATLHRFKLAREIHHERRKNLISGAAVNAARELADASFSGETALGPQRRQVLRQLQSQADRDRADDNRRGGAKCGSASASDAPRVLAHPSLSIEQARRLREDFRWAKRQARAKKFRAGLGVPSLQGLIEDITAPNRTGD